MFKKYKINEFVKIDIENLLSRELIKLEERERSLTLLINQLKHPKDTSLKLYNTRIKISKIGYLLSYFRNL